MTIYTLKIEDSEKNLYLTERNLYGSTMLGVEKIGEVIASTESNNVDINTQQQRVVGDKRFYMQNHLGNVLATVTDRKLPEYNVTESLAYYKPDVVSYSDYSPFGVTWRDGGETGKYGFNGMEKDDEIKGKGNSYDFGARMYDSRVGRWLSRDALEAKYSSLSPYNFVGNMPIMAIDPDGKRIIILNKEALEAIKLTLTPEESKFVEIDEKGELNHEKLIEGLNTIGHKNIGNNFNSLFTISRATDIVEVTISQTYENMGGEQTLPSDIQNDYEDQWVLLYRGKADLTGEITIEDVKYNYEQFKEKYDKENKTGVPAIIVSGNQGITQIPSKFIQTDFDKLAIEKSVAAGGFLDDNLENRRVTVNKASYDVSKILGVQTMAHELYGHTLFSILGKSALHGTQRDTENQELENQITISVNEADTNFKQH